MKYSEAIKVLKYHNAWRRGQEIEPTNDLLLGEAIDVVVGEWDSLKKQTEENWKHIDELRAQGREAIESLYTMVRSL